MKKTYPIVMLPTDEESSIFKWSSDGHLDYGEARDNNNKSHQNQHLYILSDEEIKEGDWCIDIISGRLYQAGLTPTTKWENQKKIIATTDKNLMGVDEYSPFLYPFISESFLPIFVKAYNEGNPITEVELEVEENAIDSEFNIYLNEHENINILELKTTESNEVIISLPEVKMYTKKEVEILVLKAIDECDGNNNQGNKWIKKNL